MSQNNGEPVGPSDTFDYVDVFVDLRPLQFAEMEPGAYEATYRDPDDIGSPVFKVTVRPDSQTDEARARIREFVDQLKFGFTIVPRQASSEEGLPDDVDLEASSEVEETIEIVTELLGFEQTRRRPVSIVTVIDPSIRRYEQHNYRSIGGVVRRAYIRVSSGLVLFSGRQVGAPNSAAANTRSFTVVGRAAVSFYSKIADFYLV